jgi:hypothetical protein
MKRIAPNLLLPLIIFLIVALSPVAALAHHGGISLGYGPGSPVETSTGLTLPQGGFSLILRNEVVEFRQFHWAEPENKTTFDFASLGLGYGFTPYLSVFLFVPGVVKMQDTLGKSYGGGDASVWFYLGGNYDPARGFRLNTQEDTAVSLETSKTTYFSLNVAASAPTGESHNHDKFGEEFERGMQPGFRSPFVNVGLTVTRQAFVRGLTFSADTMYTIFTEHDNFKFGNEFRADAAAVYDLWTIRGGFSLQPVLELNFLNVAKDQEYGKGIANSGGSIFYLSPGFRINIPPTSLGILFKLPVWKDLNKESEQQGAEGLEKFRAIAAFSVFF